MKWPATATAVTSTQITMASVSMRYGGFMANLGLRSRRLALGGDRRPVLVDLVLDEGGAGADGREIDRARRHHRARSGGHLDLVVELGNHAGHHGAPARGHDCATRVRVNPTI